MIKHTRFEGVAVPHPKRSRWAIGIVLGIAFVAAGVQVDVSRLTPLQQWYLPYYFRASVVAAITSRVPIGAPANDYPMLDVKFRREPDWRLASPRMVGQDSAGNLELLPEALAAGIHSLAPHNYREPHAQYRHWLQTDFYDTRSLLSLFPFAVYLGIPALVLGTVFGKLADWRDRRQIRAGVPIRGPLMTDRHTFNSVRKSDGIGFRTIERPTLREFLAAPRRQSRSIAIPKMLESSHLLVMGDTGTGKSIVIRQFLGAIQTRGEGAIIFDPEGEFTAEFYNESRGDVILNPVDRRSPFWNPTDELATNDEALTLASSLFPDSNDEKVKFFRMASRKIFAHLIQYDPDPPTLARWLSDPSEIDLRVAGTKMAHMIANGAQSQRIGVLSSLAEVADAFRLLRPDTDCQSSWTARSWAKERKGWIFLTATPTTLEIQRPLITLWIDTLILRLMSTPHNRQVWLIIDEFASLRKLSQLETALTRARRHQLNLILGFQVKSQIEEIYGRYRAETIVSMPATRINFRTGAPDTADWLSKAIGDHDLARARETQSQSDGTRSGTSSSQSWEVRSERLISPGQIQNLPNFCGYIKNEGLVVSFTLAPVFKTEKVSAIELRPSATQFKPLVLPPDETLAQMRTAASLRDDTASDIAHPDDTQPVKRSLPDRQPRVTLPSTVTTRQDLAELDAVFMPTEYPAPAPQPTSINPPGLPAAAAVAVRNGEAEKSDETADAPAQQTRGVLDL